jgi:hypothetical protein
MYRCFRESDFLERSGCAKVEIAEVFVIDYVLELNRSAMVNDYRF